MRISENSWYIECVEQYISEFGDVPPPWIYAPDTHPYSMMWRMGGGETLLTVFYEWWNLENKTEEESIVYFKKWPAPPRWIDMVASCIWAKDNEEYNFLDYRLKLSDVGFEGANDYEADLNDPKWFADS